ncbi:uncharacterized protein LOC111087301 [Limulus polyphemus]|uniref:Uncharacterized protein LOC111087301 n=1 Tax=Limulus polyphemus TaxID=6850 RepID=A0ABM1T007_LIMPO|nr:uncharacterized protein LOC111087301 [Limulus polyphemus]
MRAPGRKTGHEQQGHEIPEEFVFDNHELCLLNFCDIPLEVGKNRRMRKSAKLKTVSIIDTLSELAQGAADREDGSGSHPVVGRGRNRRKNSHLDFPEKTILPRWEIQRRGIPEHPKDIQTDLAYTTNYPATVHMDRDWSLLDSRQTRHQESNSSSRDLRVGETYTLSTSQGKSKPRMPITNSSSPSEDANSVSSRHYKSGKCRGAIDPSHVLGGSLKRTLKQLRKAVSSTVVGEEGMFFDEKQNLKVRRHHGKRLDRDYARLCLSDSELRTGDLKSLPSDVTSVLSVRNPCTHSKSRVFHSGLDVVATKSVDNFKPNLVTNTSVNKSRELAPTQRISQSKVGGASRRWSRAPEWIRSIFTAAKKGELEILQNCLKDMDVALIRNLSDRNGNNLWHVCCNQNHLHCLQWLCNHDDNEALKDENKNGFTPIILAIRHGNIEIVQWLLKNTNCASLLEPSVRDRSLLHYTAKYGQEQLVHWLAENVQTSINYCDSEGDTPLHVAAKYGHIGCAKALILHGADVTAKNELGLNPHDLAIYSERPSCADYFTVMEACLSLSAGHLFLEDDVQHLLSENMELKSLVKELLSLSKHLLKQQKEMLENFKVIHLDLDTFETSLSEDDGKGEKEKNRKFLNESQSSGSTPEDLPNSWPTRGLLEEEVKEWYTHILPGEEAKLQMIEDKWRRLRMQPHKGMEERRLPLDILKSQFAQILAKSSSPILGEASRIVSSSESTLSLDSLSEDEKELPPEKEFHGIQNLDTSASCCSTNLQSLQSMLDIDMKSINYSDREISNVYSHYESKYGKKIKDLKKKSTPITSSTTAKVMLQEIENTSLQSLFDRNPELRQEGKTCSVLEVLEPSSSESEENSKIKKKTKSTGDCRIEKNYNGNSSSSSVQSDKDYKIGPSSSQKLFSVHQKPSSGDVSSPSNSQEKKQGPDETQENVLTENVLLSGRSQHHCNPLTSTLERNIWNVHLSPEDETKCRLSAHNPMSNAHLSQETQVKTIDAGRSGFHEPDLIRETKVKSTSLPASNPSQKPGKTSWKAHDRRSEVKSTPTKTNQSVNEQLSSIVEPGSEVTIPSGSQGNTAKMKGFLSKLSLKGKWALKHKSRTPKKLDEISADEFREMYPRSAGISENKDNLIVSDLSTVSSQDVKIINSTKEATKKSSYVPPQMHITEDTSTCKQSFLDALLEDQKNGVVCAPSAEMSNTSSQLLRLEELPTPSVLLPPRGEPPPAPPAIQRSGRNTQDATAIQNCSDSETLGEPLEGASTCDTPLVATVLQGQKRSKMSKATSPSVRIKDCQFQQSFVVSSKPNSLSRPASSASRIDSSSHAEDNEKSSEFPLTKAFSTSTELLITPDSSTAGRQSPAPSEVSKTESALSPPSEVSKTENTKPHHLGKIEEIVNRESSSLTTVPMKEPMEVKTAAIVDITQLPKTGDDGQITTGHESDPEVKSNSSEPEHRKEIKVEFIVQVGVVDNLYVLCECSLSNVIQYRCY